MRIPSTVAKLLLCAGLTVAGTGVGTSAVSAQQTTTTASTTTSTTSPASTTTTAAPGSLPAPVPPAPAPADSCVGGSWPAVVEGAPAQYVASAPGAYLWYDPDGGWALRVTHLSPRDTVVFSGALTTSGQFVSVHRASYNRADIVFVSRDRRTIVFRFVNYGWVDGLDFVTQCSPAFTMSIAMDGQLASTDAIHLGGTAASPTNNPMRIERARGTGTPRRGRGRSLNTTSTTTSTAPVSTTSPASATGAS